MNRLLHAVLAFALFGVSACDDQVDESQDKTQKVTSGSEIDGGEPRSAKIDFGIQIVPTPEIEIEQNNGAEIEFRTQIIPAPEGEAVDDDQEVNLSPAPAQTRNSPAKTAPEPEFFKKEFEGESGASLGDKAAIISGVRSMYPRFLVWAFGIHPHASYSSVWLKALPHIPVYKCLHQSLWRRRAKYSVVGIRS